MTFMPNPVKMVLGLMGVDISLHCHRLKCVCPSVYVLGTHIGWLVGWVVD